MHLGASIDSRYISEFRVRRGTEDSQKQIRFQIHKQIVEFADYAHSAVRQPEGCAEYPVMEKSE